MPRLLSAIGIIVILGVALLWSRDRRAINRRVVLWGLTLQLLLGVLLLTFPPGVAMFKAVGDAVTSFLGFARSGSRFLFGELGDPKLTESLGFQFALTILPIIVFFSAVIAVLYHLGIMQRIVRAMARVLQRTMHTGAVESLSAAANVFLGQTEAPLLVRHYLPMASVSEIFAIMVGGFATIAGSTMGVYIAMGIPATYLIVASLLAAPGGLLLAKMVEPQGEKAGLDVTTTDPVIPSGNIIDAIAYGALDGFKLAVNVLIVLMAFVSVVALVDAGLGAADQTLTSVGIPWLPASLRELFGWIFLPVAYLIGIPGHEAQTVAALLGTKLSLTEFIAYSDLSALIAKGALSERSVTLASIALCGFANVASIGIQIGGFGMMAPDRRADVARLGFKAMCVGSMANLLAACIAGVLV
ncbi:MAG: NupC/NupG family nucleoside CNT transporter [Candidatus Kapabacteria bacterium]|nr:NupC/NupG family nucleoside CNT transporter [Candidatus Kapabacteria bacterium]